MAAGEYVCNCALCDKAMKSWAAMVLHFEDHHMKGAYAKGVRKGTCFGCGKATWPCDSQSAQESSAQFCSLWFH